MPVPAVALQVDKKTGETNELVVLLNYANTANIQKLLPAQANATANEATSKPTGLERAFVAAVQSKDQKTNAALQGAAHARFMLWTERMSDEDRARGAELKAPREMLERYIVLRYPSVGAAQAAHKQLERDTSVIAVVQNNRTGVQSWAPNDPYFASPIPLGPPSVTYQIAQTQYQWGLHAMNFPAAWDKVRGQAQIGLIENGYPGTYNGNDIATHPDLIANYRKHFGPGALVGFNTETVNFNKHYNDHATHVAGIIGAQSNNSVGISGGCVNCSLSNFPVINNSVTAPYPNETFTTNSPTAVLSAYVTAITKAVDTGIQILNWSGSLSYRIECPQSSSAICTALNYAKEREVLIVEATGNRSHTVPLLWSPLNMADNYLILPVAGIETRSPALSGGSAIWNLTGAATVDGVAAPARSIISTISAFSDFGAQGQIICGDSVASGVVTDESGTRFANGYGDAAGSCTGTSMAAPHVSAVAGLVRSVNPRLTGLELRQIIRNSGDLANNRLEILGYGLPNASTAVDAAIATNPSRLAPLFSFYSTQRSDSFYTTVPQMANAAMDATLKPHTNGNYFGANGWYASAYGSAINGYWSFPRNPFVWGGSGSVSQPKAEVWLFTTHINPKSTSVDLEPLVRMSWKCGDDTPKGVAPGEPGSFAPAVCSSTPRHIDTVLVNQSELAYFDWLGYKVDGTEGYVYPKTLPQPAGTVRLMRKYNIARDDFAAFPDIALATMQSNGYTEDGNLTDWLGYVYPNTNGQTPVIQ